MAVIASGCDVKDFQPIVDSTTGCRTVAAIDADVRWSWLFTIPQRLCALVPTTRIKILATALSGKLSGA